MVSSPSEIASWERSVFWFIYWSFQSETGKANWVELELQESDVIESEGSGDENRVYGPWCRTRRKVLECFWKIIMSFSVWNGCETLEHTTKDAKSLSSQTSKRLSKRCFEWIDRRPVVQGRLLPVTYGLKNQWCPWCCPYLLKANSNTLCGLKRLLHPWRVLPAPRGLQRRGSATRKTRKRFFNIFRGFAGERMSGP